MREALLIILYFLFGALMFLLLMWGLTWFVESLPWPGHQ